jgi:hypothetical protein
MSLPAGEQRVLDRIEDALQASEPRLASMYSIFTRLTWNEKWPLCEELHSRRRLQKLTGWLRIRRVVLAITPGPWHRPVPRALMVAQLVAVLVAIGVLVGLSAHALRSTCSTDRGTPVSLVHARSCRAQAGSTGHPIPK